MDWLGYELALSVSPNPTDGVVRIRYGLPIGNEEYEIRVYNMLGQTVFKERQTRSAGLYSTQIPVHASGVYVLTIMQGGNRETLKFTVIK